MAGVPAVGGGGTPVPRAAAGYYRVGMTFHASIDYAAAPDDVFAMLTDPAFQRRKLEATGPLNYHVDIRDDGGRTVVTGKRTLSTERATEAVRSFLGRTVLVIQTETWDPAPPGATGRRGDFQVEIEGFPVKMSGQVRLDGDGASTTEVVDADLSARIPVVGPKIVAALTPILNSAVQAERVAGQAWLREHRPEA